MTMNKQEMLDQIGYCFDFLPFVGINKGVVHFGFAHVDDIEDFEDLEGEDE